MSPAPADIIVVGGGIAGLTIAIEQANAGRRVLLLGTARPGAASRASAGMLAAGMGFPASIAPLAVAARERYPAFLAAVHAATGIQVPLNRDGIIELASDDADVARLHGKTRPPGEWLDARALGLLEPALAGHSGGVLHPRDGAVDIGALMGALERWAELHPRITRRDATVVAIEAGEDVATARSGDGVAHAAAHVVLAGGAWVDELELPRPLPVRPVHGELLLLDARLPGRVVYGGGGYLLPRDDGVLVGATSEEVGHQVRTTSAGRDALLAIAERLAPGLSGAQVLRHWAGLRPVSADGLPILGPDPARPALSYACGYSRNGILFAPWAAAQLGRMLAGESAPALGVFSVDRFPIPASP